MPPAVMWKARRKNRISHVISSLQSLIILSCSAEMCPCPGSRSCLSPTNLWEKSIHPAQPRSHLLYVRPLWVCQNRAGKAQFCCLVKDGAGRNIFLSPFPNSCDKEHDFPLLLPRLYAFCAHMQRNLCGICAQRRCPSIIYRRNIFISFLIYSPIASW